MPSRERVQALVAMVEEGKYVEAIREFYAEDASMQENGEPPPGRDGASGIYGRSSTTRRAIARSSPVAAR